MPATPALRAVAEAAARSGGPAPTVPTTLAQELAANPFLRAPDLARFAAHAAEKNNFR